MLENKSIVVAGDFIIEINSVIKNKLFKEIDKDFLVYNNIEFSASGTGFNFCVQASKIFNRVSALGVVGDDTFGGLLRKILKDHHIYLYPQFLTPNEMRTGIAIYLRDAGGDVIKSKRLLIVSNDACHALDTDMIRQSGEIIQNSTLFFADGYCFLHQPRRRAVLQAIQLAKKHGKIVGFDLVPHQAHVHFTVDEFKDWMRVIDIVIAEVRTIRSLFGFQWQEHIHNEIISLETAHLLRGKFPSKLFFLKFGVGNVNETLFFGPDISPRIWNNGYTESGQPSGFGDRLSANDLALCLDCYV